MAATDLQRVRHPESSPGASARHEVRFPPSDPTVRQDQEFCEVKLDDSFKRIRFHDYGKIYEIAGLYEQIFYERLECSSHKRVSMMLSDVLRERGENPSQLRVVEVGAGNGVVAEEFRRIGVESIVGIDILPEARMAAERDRPGVYDNYFVCDLTKLEPETLAALSLQRPNCLVTVAALGFGDIPPAAFEAAFNLVTPGGWIAFNAKLNFLSSADESGFAALLRKMIGAGVIEIEAYRVYCHRRSVRGDRLYYAALVARKRADIPSTGLRDTQSVHGVTPLPQK